MEKHERILQLMKDKGGTIAVTDPDLLAIVGPQVKSKRLTVYFSYIRRLCGVEVKTIRGEVVDGKRHGRIATAYALVEVLASPKAWDDIPSERQWQASKYK